MGQHTEYLQEIIRKKAVKMSPEQAIRRLKKKFADSAKAEEERVLNLLDLYEGIVNEVIARQIAFHQSQAATEWERVQDLETLEKEGWKPS